MGSFSVIHNSGADRNSMDEALSNRPRTHFLELCACCEKKNRREAGAYQVILITIINEKGSVICIRNNLIMMHSNKALSAQ